MGCNFVYVKKQMFLIICRKTRKDLKKDGNFKLTILYALNSAVG